MQGGGGGGAEGRSQGRAGGIMSPFWGTAKGKGCEIRRGKGSQIVKEVGARGRGETLKNASEKEFPKENLLGAKGVP